MSKSLKVRGACVVTLAVCQLIASVGRCAIPFALRSSLMHKFDFSPSSFDFSQGFDATAVQPVESARTIKSADVAKVIPTNMQTTQDQGKITSQIIDRSVNSWFDSDQVKSSSIGRASKEVEKSMQTQGTFGGSEPDSIKHSVKFTVKATETRADLEYKGLMDAQLTYFVTQDKTNLEVREPMRVLGTNLVYNNIVAPGETKNTLSVRWIF